MSNYVMSVDLFNNRVMCETEGNLVNLNDIEKAGNAWRLANGMAAYQLSAFLASKSVEEYIAAASQVWGLPKESFLKKVGKGKTSRTMAHVSVAILLAEQMSPIFHATVHKIFIEGKILEFRDLGGTEFKSLNVAIDSKLPDRIGKDNKGVFIQVAMKLRDKILGKDKQNWNEASVDQIHKRYEIEALLCKLFDLGVIRDYEHLKETIDKL